eukprot:gene15053-21130_t
MYLCLGVKWSGANGKEYKLLVKGDMKDDMRQDAVMQQFFGLVNDLLVQDRETSKRGLRMVTYKCVPFSPGAGLIEWVENTIPLADYLLGSNRNGGAHARYGKTADMSFMRAIEKMKEAVPGADQRRAFDEVCSRFTPVLHHFFLETFREPAQWFEQRIAYTRSVAVSSMAGYIIGLGDRHSGNLLLDCSTAQVVHIDLGIAFEQGRFLNTPEMVPFRLTRDIVDGMGANGVEGVMRRCCEATLGVLRADKDSLLTIIEVVIHDPLYKWALTPIKAQNRQVDGGGGPESGAVVSEDLTPNTGEPSFGNADAERAVLRVCQKLEGRESGGGDPQGVSGQVSQLLSEAQDADKLCRMFYGWASWDPDKLCRMFYGWASWV